MAVLLKNETANALKAMLTRGVTANGRKNFSPQTGWQTEEEFPGEVRIFGVWQTEETDGVKSMKLFNTDEGKPYVVVDELQKTAVESGDDMPLSGEPNKVWYRKIDYRGRAIDHR